MRDLTVVFDLDGTLIDTAPDLLRCANHALGLAGVAPVERTELQGTIGHGARAMIVKGLALRGQTLGEGEVDRLFRRYLEHYEASIAAESRPYPGLLAVLERLEADGARLAVCTNKLEGMSRKLLRELGMADWFKFIAGRDTFPFHKPHPAHLLRTIEQAGGNPARAVLVGDSDVDVATARAADVPVIAVSFGYCDPPVATFAPDRLIHHYDEFPGALQQTALGRWT